MQIPMQLPAQLRLFCVSPGSFMQAFCSSYSLRQHDMWPTLQVVEHVEHMSRCS